MAPGDGVPHRLLPSGERSRAAGQQRQALLQALEQGLRREHLDERRGQFDRQGRPSSREQISATAGALALVTAKSGLTACARSIKRRTASY